MNRTSVCRRGVKPVHDKGEVWKCAGVFALVNLKPQSAVRHKATAKLRLFFDMTKFFGKFFSFPNLRAFYARDAHLTQFVHALVQIAGAIVELAV